MLLLLVSSQRGQTMHKLDLKYMTIHRDKYIFQIPEHIKTSKPGKSNVSVVVNAFHPDHTVCPFSCLKEYICRTQSLRGDATRLFISFIKPHKPVSRDTLARWTNITLKNSGIDTDVYTAHSTRAASASKANARQVPIDEIMAKAKWRLAETFRKFYDKPIVENNNMAVAGLHK